MDRRLGFVIQSNTTNWSNLETYYDRIPQKNIGLLGIYTKGSLQLLFHANENKCRFSWSGIQQQQQFPHDHAYKVNYIIHTLFGMNSQFNYQAFLVIHRIWWLINLP